MPERPNECAELLLGLSVSPSLCFPEVAEVAIGVTDDAAGGALTAFVVPDGGSAIAPEELRAWAAARLPAHLVPSRWVGVEALPRSGHGKVDLAALERVAARPDRDRARARTGPRTPGETALFQIWSEVLGRDDFGFYDSFFDLGGHSLLATRVMARVNDTFAVDVPLRELFDGPSIAHLAEAIDRVGARPDGPMPRLERRPRQRVEADG